MKKIIIRSFFVFLFCCITIEAVFVQNDINENAFASNEIISLERSTQKNNEGNNDYFTRLVSLFRTLREGGLGENIKEEESIVEKIETQETQEKTQKEDIDIDEQGQDDNNENTIETTTAKEDSYRITEEENEEEVNNSNNKDLTNYTLSSDRIIERTNEYRVANGVHNLVYDPLLSESASNKVDLIFEEQNFSHYTNDGRGIGALAGDVGYKFYFIGENLLYISYRSGYTEEQIVDSWISSPGHRKNLISENFTEIGVSVKRGVFDGWDVWVAVQHFGKPRN